MKCAYLRQMCREMCHPAKGSERFEMGSTIQLSQKYTSLPLTQVSTASPVCQPLFCVAWHAWAFSCSSYCIQAKQIFSHVPSQILFPAQTNLLYRRTGNKILQIKHFHNKWATNKHNTTTPLSEDDAMPLLCHQHTYKIITIFLLGFFGVNSDPGRAPIKCYDLFKDGWGWQE